MNEHELKIKYQISEKLNYNFDDLKEKLNKIDRYYCDIFSSYNVYGEEYFPLVATNAWYKEKDDLTTLSEQCIKTEDTIENLSCDDNEYTKDLKVFSNLIIKNIPLEILWTMETVKKDEIKFNEMEEWAYNTLCAVAEFYLEETTSYLESIENTSKKILTK